MEVTGEEQGCVCGGDRLERGRDRLRMTGPSWMAVGPGAAVALSACPVATALPGSELCSFSLFYPGQPFPGGGDLGQKIAPSLYVKMIQPLESLLALV